MASVIMELTEIFENATDSIDLVQRKHDLFKHNLDAIKNLLVMNYMGLEEAETRLVAHYWQFLQGTEKALGYEKSKELYKYNSEEWKELNDVT